MTKFLKFKTAMLARCLLMMIFAGTAPQAIAQSFEQVAVGAEHICALDVSGQVECTATATAHTRLPPENLPAMQTISAGQQHTCGITLEGGVECWGTNAFGVLQVPTFDAPVVDITSGFNHSCALDINNQVQCWGLNSNGQLDVPDIDGGFVKLGASRNASCGIDMNGDIQCWTTDAFYNTDIPIAGPFVDLGLDASQACALTASGDIECFAVRQGSEIAPPSSGPYIDFTVTSSAICGLRTDQFLDCSFRTPSNFTPDTGADQYPLDVRFSSIERSNFQFNGVPICGVRADNGTISCFGGTGSSTTLPVPPGADATAPTLTADNIVLGLTADIYQRNQVELFWNRLPAVFPPIRVEVYRDDELLTTTSNSFSFYDNDFNVTNEESRYRVRTVDDAGNVGEFSNEIVVNRFTLEVQLNDDVNGTENPRTERILRIQNLSVTAFAALINDNDSFVLAWGVDNPTDISIAGYEIRINNEAVDFVTGTAFIGDGVNTSECRIYSVAAIAENGEILDFGSVSFGRIVNQCPR